MKDNILAIIIGIAASLIATILWWGLTQLISFRARKKIRYYISCLRTDNASFEKQLEYKDYDLALQQTHRLLTRIGEIFYSIKGLTYLPRKRKLINTLLLSLHLKLSEFQLAYKGYETKQEKTPAVRIQKGNGILIKTQQKNFQLDNIRSNYYPL